MNSGPLDHSGKSPATPLTLPDFLPEAARLAREWAPGFCAPSYARHEGCAHYHAAWTTLRLIGAITGARTDQDFFHQQFSRLAHSKPNAKVLIAGTADHAMLHMLLEAFYAQGANPEVTVADACATTLKLNRWYADKMGLPITTIQADLRTIQLPNHFDLITTHSVFSFMVRSDAEIAVGRLCRQLGKGGVLALVQGIRPVMGDQGFIVFSPDEEAAFITRAEKRWTEQGPFADLALAEVTVLAKQFADHKRSQLITSPKHILEAVESAGLEVQECVEVDRQLLRHHSSSAPQANERAFSLRLVAVRGVL